MAPLRLRCRAIITTMLGRVASGMQCCSLPSMNVPGAGVAPAGCASAGTAASQHLMPARCSSSQHSAHHVKAYMSSCSPADLLSHCSEAAYGGLHLVCVSASDL